MDNFDLGNVVMSERVSDIYNRDNRFCGFVSGCLSRFVNGDWGDVDDDDWDTNDKFARRKGGSILAMYQLPRYASYASEGCLWIHLNRDKRVITILFPEDYTLDM